MYDAIVIGARCAGAVTAMLLARKGHRVLLLDRGVIPSDVHQGHFIHKHGPRRLAEWGLLEKVVATNCPPITTHLTDFGDFRLMGRDIRLGSVAWGYGPRRRQLHQVLVDAALEACVEFRPNFLVQSCLSDGDRVEGIRGPRSPSRQELRRKGTYHNWRGWETFRSRSCCRSSFV
jgi:2-polyprenyl-6-methoxyphenol hydroxylase-like FAD-dependent oxidoreductase